MAASYDGIAKENTDQASALLNAARNTGGSIGVSLASNVLAASRAVSPKPPCRGCDPLQHPVSGDDAAADPLFFRAGQLSGQAQQQAIAWIGQQIQAQAVLLAYVDVFWTLVPVSAAAVPLALLLRKVKLGGEVHVGH